MLEGEYTYLEALYKWNWNKKENNLSTAMIVSQTNFIVVANKTNETLTNDQYP